MNAKKAKALRKVARQLVKQEVVSDWLKRGYVNHQKAVPVSDKDADGNEVITFKNQLIQQSVIDPNCGKGVYKRMKNNGAEAVFAGKA